MVNRSTNFLRLATIFSFEPHTVNQAIKTQLIPVANAFTGKMYVTTPRVRNKVVANLFIVESGKVN